MNDEPDLMRRRVLSCAGLLSIASMYARPAFADPQPAERALAFYNTHTGETLNTVYWSEGEYDASALAEINCILRDHYSGDVRPMAPQLIDLVHALRRSLDTDEPVHIISGYRSPATNAMLASRGGGVAQHSMHLEGAAIDLRLPGRDLKDVQRAALALRRGGVGYYARSEFVHVDIGRVRSW